MACCRSVAFFITSVYTRFFSLEEAVRMNSENSDEQAGFDFQNENMVLRSRMRLEHPLKIRASIFFRDMVVNLVNTGPIRPLGVVQVLN